MAKNVDNVIADYLKTTNLQLEQLPELPSVEDEVVPPADPAAVEPAPAPEPELKTMSDEAYVSAVNSMIELLSYGLHADEDAVHRDPIAKWLKMKNEISKENAFEIAQQIDDFLANED